MTDNTNLAYLMRLLGRIHTATLTNTMEERERCWQDLKNAMRPAIVQKVLAEYGDLAVAADSIATTANNLRDALNAANSAIRLALPDAPKETDSEYVNTRLS